MAMFQTVASLATALLSGRQFQMHKHVHDYSTKFRQRGQYYKDIPQLVINIKGHEGPSLDYLLMMEDAPNNIH